MRSTLCLLIISLACSPVLAHQSVPFDHCFLDAAMRIDYFHTGDSTEETVAIDQIYRQGPWAGNPDSLIDTLDLGTYCAKLYDINSNRLIFSQCFSSIFAEYKTTAPARAGTKMTCHESAILPCPRSPALFVLEKRNTQNLLVPVFTAPIDPASVNIINESPAASDELITVFHNGSPHDKVDLVFISEGYTPDERDKFSSDVHKYSDIMFATEPFKTRKSDFNLSAVFRPSSESGVDEPTKGVFKNTALSASYNALDVPRYLLIDDNKALRDTASRVPYDRIIVIANTPRYGGGGIYNDYCIFSADDARSPATFLHEFGHSFAYIADEYFNSSVAYTDYYPAGTEPLEANVTALLDPQNVKWKHLLSPAIEIPTPWGQEEIKQLNDRKQALEQKLNSRLADLPPDSPKADDLRKKLTARKTEIDKQIESVRQEYLEKYKGRIGVFEGAGYTAKGLYRSEIAVGFFTDSHYNTVSCEAISRVIDFYTRTP